MHGFDFGSEEDEIEYDADDAPLKFTFGQKVDSNASFKKRPIFAYDYISLKKSNICFDNASLDLLSYEKYFHQVNYLSTKSIADIFDTSSKDDHFHAVKLHTKPELVDEIKKIFKLKGVINLDKFPPIIQFALYTNNISVTDPSTGVVSFVGKSPRVFCLIGNNGIFHVLFLDFEHKFYPMKPVT